MNLSKNFTLEELTNAPEIFKNIPTPEIVNNLSALAVEVLQPLRDYFNLPITSHSGYRNPAYNESVGGDPNSEHLYGFADDISIKGKTNQDIIDACKLLNLPFYQIIDEQLYRKTGLISRWIHISHRRGIHNIQQVKTARNTKESLKAVYTVIS